MIFMDQSLGKASTSALEVFSKPQQYKQTIIRPTHHDNGEISFLWTPGGRLAELAYNPGESRLGFLVKDGKDVGYSDTLEDLRPELKWMTDYARVNAIKLPSRLERYESLDFLAHSIREVIHKYFDTGLTAFEGRMWLYCTSCILGFYRRFHTPYRTLRFWNQWKRENTWNRKKQSDRCATVL